MKKVSVIIPVCNREREIVRAIESVLNQKYANLEVIVVENNSKNPESIRSAVESFVNSKVHFYSLKYCKNANVARNYGMSVASGDLFAFLDSDDEYKTEHLEGSIEFLEKNDLDFCFGSIEIFDGEKSRVGEAKPLNKGDSGVHYLFQKHGFAPAPTYLMKRDFAKKIQWDEELDRHQDFDFFCQAVSKGNCNARAEATVIVHWEKGRKKKLPYFSVKRFYDKWSDDMSFSVKKRFVFAKIKEGVKYKNPRLFAWAIVKYLKIFFSGSRRSSVRY